MGDQQHSYSLKVFIVFVAAFPTGPSVCWGGVEFPQVLPSGYNNVCIPDMLVAICVHAHVCIHMFIMMFVCKYWV